LQVDEQADRQAGRVGGQGQSGKEREGKGKEKGRRGGKAATIPVMKRAKCLTYYLSVLIKNSLRTLTTYEF
jgi:hypothetical protein